MQYNDDSKELTLQIFNKLVTISSEKAKKRNSFDYFDFQDFKKARSEFPELFEWIDYPE